MAPLYKTGDLARHAGVSRQLVHEYTQLGLLQPSQRTPGGHRLYDEAALRRLTLIRDLVESGYTLRDIATTFFSPERR